MRVFYGGKEKLLEHLSCNIWPVLTLVITLYPSVWVRYMGANYNHVGRPIGISYGVFQTDIENLPLEDV